MDNFPLEVLVQIVNNIKTSEDYLSFSLVSKAINDATEFVRKNPKTITYNEYRNGCVYTIKEEVLSNGIRHGVSYTELWMDDYCFTSNKMYHFGKEINTSFV